MNCVLTNKKRELVEKNHNLIYSCVYKHRLDIDEYYDILAIGLCKAANKYSECTNFSTIAYKCMENELKMFFREQNKKSNVPSTICTSIYAEQPELEGIGLIDTIPDKNSNMDEILLKIDIIAIMQKLTEKERNIIECLMSGMSWSTIADNVGCSRSTIKNVKIKVKNFLCDTY